MTNSDLFKYFIAVLFGALIGAFFQYKDVKQNKALNEALIHQASKRIKQDKERIKMDSIALYDQKIEFTEHINNLNINRRNELNELKRKLSQLKLVTNADYINRNDSLYKYLQGSR